MRRTFERRGLFLVIPRREAAPSRELRQGGCGARLASEGAADSLSDGKLAEVGALTVWEAELVRQSGDVRVPGLQRLEPVRIRAGRGYGGHCTSSPAVPRPHQNCQAPLKSARSHQPATNALARGVVHSTTTC